MKRGGRQKRAGPGGSRRYHTLCAKPEEDHSGSLGAGGSRRITRDARAPSRGVTPAPVTAKRASPPGVSVLDRLSWDGDSGTGL